MSTIRFKVVGRVGNWRMVCREGRTLVAENTLTRERIVVYPHQITWSRRV